MRGWAVAAVVLGLGLGCGDSQQSPEPAQQQEPGAAAPSEPSPQPPPEPSPPPPPEPACTPTSCEAQHQNCGVLSDGCGGTLTCGESCTDSEPSSNVCEGLLPDSVPPKSRDILTGYIDSCDEHPAMDGQGNLVYAAGYVAYWNYRWYVQGPDGSPRNSFHSNPTPDIWPQAQGFQMVNLICGGGGSGIDFEAYDGAGQHLATVGLGNYFDCYGSQVGTAPDPAGGSVVAWMFLGSGEGGELRYEVKVQRFDGSAHARFAAVTVASWVPASKERLDIVVGTDAKGRTLVLWNGEAFFGAGTIAGIWLDARGAPMTPIFQTQVASLGSSDRPRGLAPLMGGGLVLQIDGTWIRGFASGAAQEGPPPGWLAQRKGRLEIVRGGRAYALLPSAPSAPVCSQQVEILAPDGTSCGKLTFEDSSAGCVTAPLVLGADGSILQQLPLAHRAPNDMNGCTQKWWPGVLR